MFAIISDLRGIQHRFSGVVGSGVLILLAYVLPLGIDSFAVAAALGTTPLDRRARWRISALFVTFEAGMPLIGVALGAPLARSIGGIADYLAAVVLAGVGGWMLLGSDGDADKVAGLTRSRGLAALALGVSISLDELAIGFTLGLTRLPIAIVIIAIAVQALLASQLGLALGSRVGETFREGAEKLAGLALLALGIYLAVQRALG